MPPILDTTKLTNTLKGILLKRISDGTLILPTLPKVAQELQQLLEDPKTDQAKVTKLIDRDPVLVAHVMKAANSALHRRSGKIESLSKAISSVGFRTLKNLLLTAIQRQIFVSHDPRVNGTISALWEHSLATGLLARNVAGISGCRDVEPAYIAGLLHDCGKIAVAAYMLEFERGLPTREAMDWISHDGWLNILADLHRDITIPLVEGWNLPTVIVRIVQEFEDYDAADRISPLNSVLFANALAKREGLYEGISDHEGVSSMIMIGKSLLGIDDAVISGLTREINDHILV